MNAHAIESLEARRIFDSRGRPTVEVDVILAGGAFGRAAVPSGASTGSAEAHELRDGGKAFGGRDVTKAIDNVITHIAPSVRGMDARDQAALDARMRALDGTDTLVRLGANSILGVSLAASRAAARTSGVPLHDWIAQLSRTAGIATTPELPVPMVNIFSGGLHAQNGMDVQDFLIVPLSADDYEAAIDIIWRIRSAATDLLAQRGITTLLADEGGLSPGFDSTDEAFATLTDAIELAGLRPGVDAGIALDIAASQLWNPATDRYEFARAGQKYTSAQMIALMVTWVRSYPVISIEDALHEESWPEWTTLTAQLPTTQIVGDDFFATSTRRIARGVAESAASAALIKINQNGTLTGTLEAIAMAQAGSYATVVSARSGETEDDFIADLAVGTGSGQIKIGSFRTSDRLSKYNQLTRLGETIGSALSPMTLAKLRSATSSAAFT